MDAWTVDDVQAVLTLLESLEGALWSLREVAIGLLVLGCFWFGWTLGGIMVPSAREMSWDGR